MGLVVAVSFTRHGRLHYLDPGPYAPSVGDKVLVPTEGGTEVAECIWAAEWISDDTTGLPVLAGLAGPADLERDADNRRRKAQARVAAKRLVREHGLAMKVVAIDVLDRSTTTIVYFTADGRIDFRALVSDLARTLDCRVELRSISARDDAKVQGGIGPCGRDTCCSSFLKDFEPVTLRMAKDQGLALDPLRISGACGKLLCCLKYENPLYAKYLSRARRSARRSRAAPSSDRTCRATRSLSATPPAARKGAAWRRCAVLAGRTTPARTSTTLTDAARRLSSVGRAPHS